MNTAQNQNKYQSRVTDTEQNHKVVVIREPDLRLSTGCGTTIENNKSGKREIVKKNTHEKNSFYEQIEMYLLPV